MWSDVIAVKKFSKRKFIQVEILNLPSYKQRINKLFNETKSWKGASSRAKNPIGSAEAE